MKGITLLSLLNVALKNILILILTAILFGAGAFTYCEYFCSEKYSAKGSLLVTNGGINIEEYIAENDNYGAINSSDISASMSIVNMNKFRSNLKDKTRNQFKPKSKHTC